MTSNPNTTTKDINPYFVPSSSERRYRPTRRSHNTRNACSTFNMLQEEQRLVAACLLPLERKELKKIKSGQ